MRSPRRPPASNPALYKALAFGVSSFYAGVAGALLVIEVSFVNPDTFPLSLSILLLASAVIGGLGALSGVLFGALVLEFLPVYAQDPPLIAGEFSYAGAVGRLWRDPDRDRLPAPRRVRRSRAQVLRVEPPARGAPAGARRSVRGAFRLVTAA